MKKYLLLILIITSCNRKNSNNDSIGIRKDDNVELKKFYDSDVIEHYYLDISEKNVMKIAEIENRNEDQRNLLSILVGNYPDSISEKSFENNLIKFKFVKTKLTELKRKEVENVFSQKDSLQTEFSSCLPFYRDIFIFKKKDSIVGIAKVCFGCGVSRFLGTKTNTDGFGLHSELNKLRNIIREK